MRLAHLSDIHFGGENAAAVAAVTDHLRNDPVDLTVVTGDLTRYAEIPEFEAAAEWLASLPGPQLVTPGNHDAPYLAWAERIFAPFARYDRLIGPSRMQAYVNESVVVRGVNTARGAQPRINWSKGQISRRQIEAATGWFAQKPAAPLRVIACHHPLTEMIGGPMTARVWNGTTAAKAFAGAGVDLILSGHIHAPFAWPLPFGDSRTYAVGAGTLSLRERGVRPSWNCISFDEASITIVSMAWDGVRFAAERTWSLDRRVR
jgi:3',5'-cyclic AMP phosphodiesterase CpdA